MSKDIVVNPNDWEGMLKLMEDADMYPMPVFGKNEEGETTMISINKDNITVQTFQNNGWVRENVYWNDFTTEELFSK